MLIEILRKIKQLIIHFYYPPPPPWKRLKIWSIWKVFVVKLQILSHHKSNVWCFLLHKHGLWALLLTDKLLQIGWWGQTDPLKRLRHSFNPAIPHLLLCLELQQLWPFRPRSIRHTHCNQPERTENFCPPCFHIFQTAAFCWPTNHPFNPTKRLFVRSEAVTLIPERRASVAHNCYLFVSSHTDMSVLNSGCFPRRMTQFSTP